MAVTLGERKSGDVYVLQASGFIDTSTVSVVEEKITKLFAEGKYKLVVDLSGVEFVSSAGWGVFVAFLKKMRDKDGDLKLSGMIEKVAKVFTLMEFDSLMDAYADEDAAVKSFSR
jgi:anti-sigma B factor antagonist